VALASFRALMRAPEARIMFLSSIVTTAIVGVALLAQTDPAEYVRPLYAFGAMSIVLLTMMQLAGNQFGFDRAGFRAYVLSPAPRRDILLGKNLAFAPFAFGLAAVFVAALQVFRPLRLDHLLALCPQFLSMYLVFMFMMNWLALFAPMPMAAGSLRAMKPKGSTSLLYLLFTILIPLALAPTLMPLGVEFALRETLPGVPLCLILSLALAAGMVCLYRLALGWQAQVLQAREQDILEVVTAKAE
jgi:hypothetical protein